MTDIFADAFYYFALLNPEDEAHLLAREYTEKFTGVMYTTHWVLTEIADGMAEPANRPLFLELIESLGSDERVMIVPADLALFEQAIALYRERPDKAWSLTDCTSFVVMQQHGIVEALTGDHHFEQAGFQRLLK
jgi:predicted nucleic acid-binding protein